MDKQMAFWFLVGTTGLLLLVIYNLGFVLHKILGSELFRDKMKKVDEQQSNKTSDTLRILPWLIAGLLLPAVSQAESVAAEDTPLIQVTEAMLWALGSANVVLLCVIWYLKNLINKLLEIDRQEEAAAEAPDALENITRALIDIVPIEEEESILMDHEYDGIRELDNNLPPWWKWGFYVSIGFAVVYLMNYHVLFTGMLQEEAYEQDLAQAAAHIEKYLADQAMNVDELTVTVLEGQTDLAAGNELFQQYCKACHGQYGEGLVGPNLTDDYWIHGGSIKDVFSTIKYGAENGMKSWKDELNQVQMQQVASYIQSLHGTNPANAKEAQGTLYVPEEAPAEEAPAEIPVEEEAPATGSADSVNADVAIID